VAEKAGRTKAVDAFAKRLETDPTARLKLLSRLTETLAELGVKPQDMTLLSGLIIGTPATSEPPEIVIVTRSDGHRNTKSIIVAGRSTQSVIIGS